jgi:RHH-type proline utilization regulon transcriptional repressor/proline dehydrogenase/delta 1-pyrroline-5-carboxylate dehydrogenase
VAEAIDFCGYYASIMRDLGQPRRTQAVAGCVASAFGYQGQKCSALSRLVVLETVYAKFLEWLIAAAVSLRVGPAEVPGTIIGPVINRVAQARIQGIIEAGKQEARLAWQGIVPADSRACLCMIEKR